LGVLKKATLQSLSVGPVLRDLKNWATASWAEEGKKTPVVDEMVMKKKSKGN